MSGYSRKGYHRKLDVCPPANAADILLDSALRDWWDCRANGADQWRLLEAFGLNSDQCFTYSRWSWAKLPGQLRRFVVQHSLSGKPLDYLDY